ncbi:hypothetical protein V3C99_018345 [Haemonchus contortus]|uniref:Uncharacterized protein n=1 Tax=Haemonchus contortus TaxID=6289 RepID=A0A7I4Z589_HAECO
MISQEEQLRGVVASQAERIRQLEQQVENMERELCVCREAYDLLEFQILENEQNNKCLASLHGHDICIGTEKTTMGRPSTDVGSENLVITESERIIEQKTPSNQLIEYNSHLEHQFRRQSQIIEVMKRKLSEQMVFANLVYKLSKMRGAEMIQKHLDSFIDSAENENKMLAENFSRIIQISRGTMVESFDNRCCYARDDKFRYMM